MKGIPSGWVSVVVAFTPSMFSRLYLDPKSNVCYFIINETHKHFNKPIKEKD